MIGINLDHVFVVIEHKSFMFLYKTEITKIILLVKYGERYNNFYHFSSNFYLDFIFSTGVVLQSIF